MNIWDIFMSKHFFCRRMAELSWEWHLGGPSTHLFKSHHRDWCSLWWYICFFLLIKTHLFLWMKLIYGGNRNLWEREEGVDHLQGPSHPGLPPASWSNIRPESEWKVREYPWSHNPLRILLIIKTEGFIPQERWDICISPVSISQMKIIRLKYLFLTESLDYNLMNRSGKIFKQ